MDRRDLLKYFGIGTTIIPMADGAPIIQAAAELISVPELKPTLVDKFPDGHEPEHWRDRLEWNPFEVIWLKMWQIENNPSRGINYGIGPLEHCLKRTPTSEEKAAVAVAAIMQWFGSNCGHGFLHATLRTCGYRVQWDDSLPGCNELRAIQSAGIWPNSPFVPPFTIERFGRKIHISQPVRSV